MKRISFIGYGKLLEKRDRATLGCAFAPVFLRQTKPAVSLSQEKNSNSQFNIFIKLSRGAVSKLIDRLLQKGLVSRIEGTVDRRYQEIQLTKDGKKLVPKLAKVADENDSFFFSILNQSEKEFLRKTLIKLTNAHKLHTNPIE